MTRAAALLLAAALLAGCAPVPLRTALPSRWEPSPNVDERRVAFVVIHYTGDDSAARSLRTLTSRSEQVSAHYLIARDGSIVQLVDERARAWHAGESRWGTVVDLNSASIGIELDNNGREPFAQLQLDTLLALLADLRQRHRLRPAAFLGHSDVAPSRKPDPGPLFPWRRLAAAGFGLWCEAPFAPAPPGFDPLLGLRAIGYDLRRPEAAIAAFRTRYLPEQDMAAPLARDADLIQCLLQAAAVP